MNDAVHHYSKQLVVFGNGHDLYITDNCNTNKMSYACLGQGYEVDDGIQNSKLALKELAGEENFTVAEIEVW